MLDQSRNTQWISSHLVEGLYCNGPGDDKPQIFYAVKIRGTGRTTESSAHAYVYRYDTDDTL